MIPGQDFANAFYDGKIASAEKQINRIRDIYPGLNVSLTHKSEATITPLLTKKDGEEESGKTWADRVVHDTEARERRWKKALRDAERKAEKEHEEELKRRKRANSA